MNNYTIGIALVVAVGLLFWGATNYGGEKDQATSVMSEIIVVDDLYDFGDIDIFGGKVETPYTLRNNGGQDVKITSAVTSCMCTEGEIGGLRFGMHESSGTTVTIPAGGEKVLTAIYDPLAHGPNGVGPVKRELFLKTNSEITPDIKVQFTANVVKNDN